MINLTLSSNFNDNKLFGVGEALLQGEIIKITTEPNTTVILLRGANKVVLTSNNDRKVTTSGKVTLGDVYTLENSGKVLNIRVEKDEMISSFVTKHETDLFIDNDKPFDATLTKRKTTLTAGVLIMALLITSVVFGIKQKNLKEFNIKSEEKLNLAITNYDLQTRETFVLAKETAEELKNSGYKSDKLDELLRKINENESEILGEVKSEVKELLDLTLQISGFSGSKLSSTGETMFVFDEKEKNIIQLGLDGKSAKIVAKSDVLEGVNNIASYEDRLFTLNNDGIYEIDGDRSKVKDNEWTNPLFYLYSANIYLVDRSNNQILRYSGNGKTFGDKAEWLAPGIEADFSKVIDMTIDGSIWLLSSSGKVTKFTNGNPASITMDGIVSPLTNPTAIYTNEVNKNVYILDKDNGRVVVLEKNGDFKIQYISDQIKNATDLVVSEEEGKLILLVGSKLMYISI